MTLSRIRILYVIDSMGRGGAETQLLRTLARLNRDNFEAFVVLSREEGNWIDRLAILPIVKRITVLRIGSRNSVSALIAKVFKLASISNVIQPSIIHSWLWYSNFLCGLARQFSALSDIPLIVSQRGDYHARYGRLRLWLTERIIYNRANIVLTNAVRLRDYLRTRYPEKRIITVQNIVRSPNPSPLSESKLGNVDQSDLPMPHIVSVGRLVPEKGCRYLVQALNLLNTKYNFSDFTATILGEGALKDELNRLADSYHLSNRLRLPGFSEDILPILSGAHLFVLPSLHESAPNALIEAMEIGLPCIASDVGGVSDLIEDRESGMLVPAADPEALARAIHRVLTDGALAKTLGEQAQAKIRRLFDNDQSIQQLEAVYRNVL